MRLPDILTHPRMQPAIQIVQALVEKYRTLAQRGRIKARSNARCARGMHPNILGQTSSQALAGIVEKLARQSQ